MNPSTYGKDAVARYYARHAKADDTQWNSAGFTWNSETERYEIEVCGFIVATFPSLAGVKMFSAMHNTERAA